AVFPAPSEGLERRRGRIEQIVATHGATSVAGLPEQARRFGWVGGDAATLRVQHAQVGAAEPRAMAAGLRVQPLRIAQVDRDALAMLVEGALVVAALGKAPA